MREEQIIAASRKYQIYAFKFTILVVLFGGALSSDFRHDTISVCVSVISATMLSILAGFTLHRWQIK
jgi:hypothetical protein